MSPLLGSWRLLRYAIELADGAILEPYGPAPEGVLHYAADGQMFVHMMAPGRAPLGCDTALADGLAARAALATHLSYCGAYKLLGDRIEHVVTVSALPDFVGQTLRRDWALDDDHLTLTARETSFGGRTGTARLTWRRHAPHDRSPR